MATRDYEGDGITVHWDSSRCIHTARCVRALPEVFDSQRRPWIDVGAASAGEVADAVMRCPTGALRFSSPDLAEEVPQGTTLRPLQGGPMLVRGNVHVVDRDGNTICHETRVAFCRCGNSRNQPFCDNSHRDAGFTEPELRAQAAAPAEVCEPQDLFDD